MPIPDHLPIEPSPRILQMLGHVNFQGWQCLAELIDNSIDAFLNAPPDEGHGQRSIQVSLPTPTQLDDGSGSVVVQDNAGGMSLQQMQESVRAGYSGNDPIGRLGLFGMGFNVSTARIGRVTEILSHRPEDGEWLGLRIDIDEMIRNRTWNAPVIREPLEEGDPPSGTRVRIKLLPRQGVVRGMIYGRGKPALVKKLSRLYHVAIQRYGVEIRINETPLSAWRLCLWGPARSVPSDRWGRVPAQIPVDLALATLPYCLNCWEWGTEGQVDCYLCGAQMVPRERRIKGVLGIQRSFSIAWGEGELSHYGIDLIRNGRVIEEFDKDLFEWVDPGDPARRELDYPVDAVYLGGRIVGELEVDFLPLRSYHKDSFEKSDPSWLEVRNALRGEPPLRPDIARRYGYDRPDTPLARLFDAYRKSSPAGERYLVTGHPPGRKPNPRTPMHTAPELEEWIKGFESGDEQFEADTKWWEAVQWAERQEGEVPETDEPTASSIFDVPEEAETQTDEEQHVEDEELEQGYEAVADESLSLTISTEGIVRNAPAALEVAASKVVRGELPGSYSVSVDPRGPKIDFTWNPRHPDFAQGTMHPVDCLVHELAVQILYRAQVTQREFPISYVQREVARRAFPERDVTVENAAQRATELLQSLKAFLEAVLQEHGPFAITLDSPDLASLERAAAAAGVQGAAVPGLITSGEFVRFMPLKFLPKCALYFPSVLMGENGYFGLDYQGYETEELRAELRETLYANLLDVTWLVEQRANLGATLTDLARIQLQKSISALELLELRRT